MKDRSSLIPDRLKVVHPKVKNPGGMVNIPVKSLRKDDE